MFQANKLLRECHVHVEEFKRKEIRETDFSGKLQVLEYPAADFKVFLLCILISVSIFLGTNSGLCRALSH